MLGIGHECHNALPGVPPTGFSRSLSYLRTRVSITLVLAHMLDSLVRVSRRVGSHQNGTPSWIDNLRGGGVDRGASTQIVASGHRRGRGLMTDPFRTTRDDGAGRVRSNRNPTATSTIRLLPTISRTVSLSFQSPFHLSLTVLVRYRSPTNI